jgi:heme A synthase
MKLTNYLSLAFMWLVAIGAILVIWLLKPASSVHNILAAQIIATIFIILIILIESFCTFMAGKSLNKEEKK